MQRTRDRRDLVRPAVQRPGRHAQRDQRVLVDHAHPPGQAPGRRPHPAPTRRISRPEPPGQHGPDGVLEVVAVECAPPEVGRRHVHRTRRRRAAAALPQPDHPVQVDVRERPPKRRQAGPAAADALDLGGDHEDVIGRAQVHDAGPGRSGEPDLPRPDLRYHAKTEPPDLPGQQALDTAHAPRHQARRRHRRAAEPGRGGSAEPRREPAPSMFFSHVATPRRQSTVRHRRRRGCPQAADGQRRRRKNVTSRRLGRRGRRRHRIARAGLVHGLINGAFVRPYCTKVPFVAQETAIARQADSVSQSPSLRMPGWRSRRAATSALR